MNLDEFIEIYYEYGEVVARLRANEVHEPSLIEVMERLPEVALFFDYPNSSWVYHLRNDGRLGDKCPVWNRLSSVDWYTILCLKPEYAKYCDWSKLNPIDYRRILIAQPQFVGNCGWDILAGWDWACLIHSQPQFAKFCQWEKLDDWDWSSLLATCPEYSHFCNVKFESGPGAQLLISQPQLCDKVDLNVINQEDWIYLLSYQPDFMGKCPRKANFTESQIIDLLTEHQTIANYIENWNFRTDSWVRLARNQPQLLIHCQAWNLMNVWELLQIVTSNNALQFIKWEEIPIHAWVRLIHEFDLTSVIPAFFQLSKKRQDEVIDFNPAIIDLTLEHI